MKSLADTEPPEVPQPEQAARMLCAMVRKWRPLGDSGAQTWFDVGAVPLPDDRHPDACFCCACLHEATGGR